MPPQTVPPPSPSSAAPAPSAEAGSEALPRIVPVRRTGRWTAAVAVLVLLGLALDSVVRNDAFQWDVVLSYFATVPVLRGLWLTLWLTAVVMVLGFALGALLAVLRLSGNPVLQAVSWGTCGCSGPRRSWSSSCSGSTSAPCTRRSSASPRPASSARSPSPSSG